MIVISYGGAHQQEWEPYLAWRFQPARVSVFWGRQAVADPRCPVKQAVYFCWKDHTRNNQAPNLLWILP